MPNIGNRYFSNIRKKYLGNVRTTKPVLGQYCSFILHISNEIPILNKYYNAIIVQIFFTKHSNSNITQILSLHWKYFQWNTTNIVQILFTKHWNANIAQILTLDWKLFIWRANTDPRLTKCQYSNIGANECNIGLILDQDIANIGCYTKENSS